MKLVYATSNIGKYQEIKKLLGYYHLDLFMPSDFGVNLKVAEPHLTLEENAAKKAESYVSVLPNDCAVIGDDTGVFIAALGGKPGVHVRRWKGYEMTDQEIITYCIAEMKDIPLKDREAEMRTVVAVASKSRPTIKYEGKLLGAIVEHPIKLKIAGFPFESLFLASEYDLMLGEIHTMSIEEKISKQILTHRERAIMLALPYLQDLFAI